MRARISGQAYHGKRTTKWSEHMIYDCAVIGTGPAGLSAALNLKIHEKSFLWIGRRALSDKIARAEQIRNYPGFPDAGGDALAGRSAATRRPWGWRSPRRWSIPYCPWATTTC